MANFILVDVLNARNDLLKEFASLIFLESLSLDNVFEKFSTRCVLHDEEQLPGGFDDFVQLNDVRVTHYLEDVDFTRDSLHIALVLNLVLF